MEESDAVPDQNAALGTDMAYRAIKPYVPRFDVWESEHTGWFATKAQQADILRSDDRFHSFPTA